jgi:hypothetical protein
LGLNPLAAQETDKRAALPPDPVRDVVGASHRDLNRVKELVEATPLLVNACWDWGGGDFETALQAAAHTGRREIALYLIERGARPDLFAAAMLGQLEVVQAAVAARAETVNLIGPHGFTLLHCAQRGGEAAVPVVAFLQANGAGEVTRHPLPYAPS